MYFAFLTQPFVRTLFLAGFMASAFAAVTLTAGAQAPVTQSATDTQTATIVAIDQTQRIVTLQFADGSSRMVRVGPDITRFSSLKVGDKVTFTSTVSVAYAIAKPGTSPPPESATTSVAPGDKPGGTVSRTLTTVVTVMSMDKTVPSVTVKTADGRITSFIVKDPKNLENVKVGDQVQVTYSESLMVNVK